MQYRNFTGQLPNFIGGFSGFSQISTEAPGILWNLSTYKYRNVSLSTGTESAPTGLWFRPDGTRVFVVGNTTDRIRSWDLTTAWNIGSATNQIAMANTLRDTGGVALANPSAVSFSDDGTRCFVTDLVANALYRYTLTTAWDVTTIGNADQVNTTIYTGNLTPQSIWVRPDGLMFLTSNSGTTSQYRTWTTAVANDITTLTAGTTLAGGNTPVGANFVDNGNRMIYATQANDTLTIGSASPAYSITSITGTNTRVVTAQDTTPQDLYMRNDGEVFFYLGSASNRIYQYTLN
jgi:WD40 repeat protein